VEDGAEEGGVYLGAYFIGSFQAGYVSVVEFQAAVQIGIEDVSLPKTAMVGLRWWKGVYSLER
jgi:hypothetical protein